MAVTGRAWHVMRFSVQGDTASGLLAIKYMRWLGGTTAGHKLVVNDSASNLLWESDADGANFNDIHPLSRKLQEFFLL